MSNELKRKKIFVYALLFNNYYTSVPGVSVLLHVMRVNRRPPGPFMNICRLATYCHRPCTDFIAFIRDMIESIVK